MGISKWVITYFLTAVIFFGIDLVWLGLIARGFYQDHLGAFFKEQINWTAALLFYFLFLMGMVVFVIHPAFGRESLGHALIYGLLFGLVTYGTYDLTNLALLKGWPVKIVVVDMFWGTLLSGMTSTGGFLIAKWMAGS